MKKALPLIALLFTLAVAVLFAVYAQIFSNKQPVAGDSSGVYFKDARGVYISVPRDCFGPCGPDFRPAWQKFRQLPHADPNTFQIVIDSRESMALILARDQNHIYYGGYYVPDGDPSTLQIFGDYAKDKLHLYQGGKVISGIDIETAKVLGMDFVRDQYGLYVANGNPPRKPALLDATSFRLEYRRENGRDYIGEDKNFDIFSNGGTYMVKPKTGVQDFNNLGCGYYNFRGTIFYSLYQLADANPASFRVLRSPRDQYRDLDDCLPLAVDEHHRYQFDTQVRPDDSYHNHQIDVLLATPEQRRTISTAYTLVCVRKDFPGTNFGFERRRDEPEGAGTIQLTQYQDAGVIEPRLKNTAGEWQALPAISDGSVITDCHALGMAQFYDANHQKPWLARRDASSISLKINQFGSETIFVTCDSGYNVKSAFTQTVLISELKKALGDSQVVPYERNDAWGSGWILEDKFFVDQEGSAEVWVPLRIKDESIVRREARDFVTVGFRYREHQFECLAKDQCLKFRVPTTFKMDPSY